MNHECSRRGPRRKFNGRLAILLAMAMFVLVFDTSLMNVSISAVVARSRHDRQRGAGCDRAGGARLGGVHPDRRQDGRSDRPQTRLHPRPARLCRRSDRDDARAGPHRHHHLLGRHRRARRFAAAAVDAVAHPRQLPGGAPEARLRARRGLRGDRGGGRPAARRVHHDVPVVAGGLPARGGHHRDRAGRHQARQGRPVHGRPVDRSGRVRPLGHRHGRRGPRHPGVAGGRRLRRAHHRTRRRGPRRPRVLAQLAQEARQADADRSRPVRLEAVPRRA